MELLAIILLFSFLACFFDGNYGAILIATVIAISSYGIEGKLKEIIKRTK